MTGVASTRATFRDGERLTAGRLNAAFEGGRSTFRRALLGVLSPGAALGLALRSEVNQTILVVEPGLAIDRRGRLAVLAASARYDRAAIERVVGALGDGDVIRVGIRLGARQGEGDCGPGNGDATEYPEILLRKLTPQSGGPFPPIPFDPTFVLGPIGVSTQQLMAALLGPLVNYGSSCVPVWGDLDLPSVDPDGCSVVLGVVTVTGPTLVPSMDDRAGIAPRFDVLRNSIGDAIMELRTRTGDPRVNFLAPAGGRNVQATRLAYAHSDVPAARVSPSAGQVVEFAGGTPSGSVPFGQGGLATFPLPIQPDTGTVVSASVVELYVPISGGPDPIGPGAIRPLGGVPADAFGLVGAPTYQQGTGGPRVAPIAVAGILQMQVSAEQELDVQIGSPLAAVNATTLRLAQVGETVVAISAQRPASGGLSMLHVFPVHPPRKLT